MAGPQHQAGLAERIREVRLRYSPTIQRFVYNTLPRNESGDPVISESRWRRYESGKSKPGAAELAIIAQLSELSVDWLVLGTLEDDGGGPAPPSDTTPPVAGEVDQRLAALEERLSALEALEETVGRIERLLEQLGPRSSASED